MLDLAEAAAIQQMFGVASVQVRRDHAISHILKALESLQTEFVFYGGTALARTYLASGRLSEDIDLYTDKRDLLIQEMELLPTWLEQEFPNAYWEVSPLSTKDPESALLSCDPSAMVKVQIIDSKVRTWSNVPIRATKIEQRFSDVSPTELQVPTFDGFVAMKALVWFDRRAPRDLFDLSGLSEVGPVTDVAHITIDKLLGHSLSKEMLTGHASGDWRGQLAHQTKNYSNEAECLARVLEWWGA